MSMLSLHCGLRIKEVLSLTWGDINFIEGQLLIRDSQKSKTRYAIMTNSIKNLLSKRKIGSNGELLFAKPNGEEYKETPKIFRQTVKELGFNDGITDRRDKVVFHTLRHTFASWLVQNGVDLYTVQKLMGHSTIAMTERYAHLAPDNLKDAVRKLEDSINRERLKNEKAEVIDINKSK